jgi:cholera toxin transcriptional activator
LYWRAQRRIARLAIEEAFPQKSQNLTTDDTDNTDFHGLNNFEFLNPCCLGWSSRLGKHIGDFSKMLNSSPGWRSRPGSMASIAKYKFDEFEADLRAAELRRNGTRLKLQMQPFQVLIALLERPNEVVTREELRQRLWPQDTFVDFDHGLNTAMVKLRDVLGDSASRPKYIETIAKRGYRFLGNPEAVPETPRATATPPSSAQPDPPPTKASVPALFSEPGPPFNLAEAGSSAQPAVIAPEPELPRASRNTARVLFILAQIMYLIFYLSALFRWENTYRASYMAWARAGAAVFTIYIVTALVGLVIRLYLTSATAMDYHLLGQKFRLLMPGLFVLDMLWAMAPLLIQDRIGFGFALAACAALIYMPFAQWTLMKMVQIGK